MAGRARTAARGPGRPCRADGTGHEKGGCCGIQRCWRVPEPRGEPTWSRGSSSPGPSRRGQEKPGVGHAGGAQDSAQPAGARLPRGSWCWARAWLSPAPLRAGTAPSLQALGPLPGQRRVNTTCHCDPNSRPGGWGRGPGGLSPLCPCLSRRGEPRPGHSTAGMASPALSRGEGSPPSSCCQGFAQCSPGYHSPPPLGKGTLLAPGQPGVRQDPWGLFCHAACQQLCQAAFGHE